MGVYNHTGLVVTDLDRAKRFYEEVFGFAYWYEITPPDEPTAKLSSLTPPLSLTASYLVLDGFVLELMQYAAPGATAPFRLRPLPSWESWARERARTWPRRPTASSSGSRSRRSAPRWSPSWPG